MATLSVRKEIWSLIEILDLEPIKVKIMDRKEGLGWTLEQTNEVEEWYRRFLFLNYTYLDQPIVPTKLIDQFWHQHILDTLKYAVDCQRIFGYFLHHFPYFGMRGEEDAAQLVKAAADTRALYVIHFGESPCAQLGVTPDCDSSACDSQPNCGSSCNGVYPASVTSRHTERPHLQAN